MLAGESRGGGHGAVPGQAVVEGSQVTHARGRGQAPGGGEARRGLIAALVREAGTDGPQRR